MIRVILTIRIAATSTQQSKSLNKLDDSNEYIKWKLGESNSFTLFCCVSIYNAVCVYPNINKNHSRNIDDRHVFKVTCVHSISDYCDTWKPTQCSRDGELPTNTISKECQYYEYKSRLSIFL